ncbi:hypothetical protein PTSG_09514 [Salpingoeca rosetta]|uniref:peptide-methionine (R)-S-oxide reductase n=1 Tax=Salpingoeca rosetta (strain ATCC 50818 / BSB-021) TaxID=946362 RepID=F2UL81_SALR5|nr:uncharacterized protein PTSG_09514 [Salpingoeca rosetta]EGD77880.1 hypothetical protein PTSG_09514 [Salpingoeca rosetta]|eukprot:XP_004989944.1 hypothetical protein PTSG_09514 [Salpingoeca rosetta]
MSDSGDVVWACRLPKAMSSAEKEELKQKVSRANPAAFHAASRYPITKEVEDILEQMSLVATREEYGNDFWQEGSYSCSRCHGRLYCSKDKFHGPCLWPSFRQPVADDVLLTRKVDSYNNYTCEVHEVYCNSCQLFLGHMFEDGKEHGDTHPDARWRHCVLSLSLDFAPSPASSAQ